MAETAVRKQIKQLTKRELKGLVKYVIAFFALAVGFTAAVTLVALLPAAPVQRNIERSLEHFERENEQWLPMFGSRRSMIDMGTDIIMANMQYNTDTSRPFWSAMTGPRFVGYSGNFFDDIYGAVQGQESNKEYFRYWHGWTLWVRPLLMLFNYQQIRVVLNIVFYALAAACLFLIYKRLSWLYTVPFALMLWSAYFITVPMNWQFFSVYLVALISCICILLKFKPEKPQYIALAFFIIGAFTSFVDFLTAPVVTFGMPAVLVISMLVKESAGKFAQKMLLLIRMGAAWFGGYVLLWVSKWVITDIFTDPEGARLELGMIAARTNASWYAVRDGIDQILFRTGAIAGYTAYNERVVFDLPARLNIFTDSVRWMFNSPALIVTLLYWLLALGAVALLVYHMRKRKDWNATVFAAIALIPVVWLLATASHVFVHMYFTFRGLSVAVYALSTAALIAAVDLYRNRNNINNKRDGASAGRFTKRANKRIKGA